jgi:hypothetical protein
MYVGDFKDTNDNQRNVEIDHFFKHVGRQPTQKIATPTEPQPEEKLIAEHSADVLAHWQAPEFVMHEPNTKGLLYIIFLFIALIAYALYANSPIMAITFVLFGVVGYIHLGKQPRILDFMLTYDGIIAGREIFHYENIKSFWIFYEADDIKVISLHIDSYLTPFIHIPIHDEDPVAIREILLNYIEEIKQEPSIVDTLERFLGI